MKNNFRLLIFLIKANRIVAVAWAALVIAAYFLLTNTSPAFYYCPGSVLLFIFAIFLLYFLTLFMKNQFKKINKLLFMDCDPFAYIEIYRHIIDELIKAKKLKLLDYYRVNLSAGLIAAGRYDEAYEVLSKYGSFKNSRVGRLSTIVYYNNLCSVCLKLGRVDEAKYYLDCLAGCVAALSPRDHQKYIKYVDLAQYGVNMAKGIFDNAENFYNEVFHRAAGNYEKVNAKFRLGNVHLHSGDAVRAKEAFEYVVFHGNKLHIVGEAKEQLGQIAG